MVTLINMPTTSFHMLRLIGADCGNCVMIPIPLAWYPGATKPRRAAQRDRGCHDSRAAMTITIAPVHTSGRRLRAGRQLTHVRPGLRERAHPDARARTLRPAQ